MNDWDGNFTHEHLARLKFNSDDIGLPESREGYHICVCDGSIYVLRRYCRIGETDIIVSNAVEVIFKCGNAANQG